MKAYINAYSVLELLPWEIHAIRSLGFDGVRFDVLPTTNVRASCDVLAPAGLRALMLVNGGEMPLGDDETLRVAVATAHAANQSLLPIQAAAIEVGNEPDISPHFNGRPQEFGQLVDRVAAAIFDQVPGLTVVSGGVFSTSGEGVGYLGLAARKMRPGIVIGVHSYRQNQGPLGAHRPYSSRTDELLAIASAVNGRRIWCTETGWHTAPFPLRFCRKGQWSDEQVLGYLQDELQFQAAAGTEVTVVYQWASGPSSAGIDQFGLRRFGSDALRPQSRCLEGASWRVQ